MPLSSSMTMSRCADYAATNTQPHPARTEFRVSRDLSFFILDLQ